MAVGCKKQVEAGILAWVNRANHGARGCGRPNLWMSSGQKPLVNKLCRISIGLSPLRLAVCKIVAMKDTFFLPWSERLPKVIFLNKTQFCKLCSLTLFVGKVFSGWIKKVKISSLCLNNLLRRVSVLGCGIGFCHRSLNRENISFLRMSHSSKPLSLENWLCRSIAS